MSEPMYSVGPIMKAARKFKKLNQADVAKAIGCSQSALSKMEHNLLIPSAPQWFLFSRFTSIPPESLETGIIDRRSPVRFNSADVSMGFKIPKKYRQHRAEKIRELYPFLQNLEKENPQLVAEFITGTGLDPEFFLDFDNLINFQLLAEMIEFYIKHGKHSVADVRKVVEIGQNEIYWDHWAKDWKKSSEGKIHKLLAEYINCQNYFQSDFALRMEGASETRVAITFLPEFHLKQQGAVFSGEVIDFLNTYRKFSLQNLIKKILQVDVQVDLVPDAVNTLGARLDVKLAS